MSITKKYLSDNEVCRVTFTLPPGLAEMAKTACIVGEFNNWDPKGLPMKKKSGKFSLSLELKSKNEYEFRYLVNGTNWETDWDADRLATVPWGGDYNSVVKV